MANKFYGTGRRKNLSLEYTCTGTGKITINKETSTSTLVLRP